MTYALIAYGLVAGVLAAYAANLLRERNALRRRLAEAPQGDRT